MTCNTNHARQCLEDSINIVPRAEAGLTKLIRTEIFFRSLLIPSSFNKKGLQNLGFAFSILPLARAAGDNDYKRALLSRHLERFNTHPYLSSSIIGQVIHLEERCVGLAEGEETIKLKNMLAGPYAAIGDSFFWVSLRSFASLFSVIIALGGSLIAVGAFLLLFNPAHLYVRYRGFIEGYRKGRQSIEFMKSLDLPRLGGRIRKVTYLLTAILMALVLRLLSVDLENPWSWPTRIGLLLVILSFAFLIRRGFSPLTIFYVTMVGLVIIRVIWF